jgi:hypothetical protein
MKRKFPLKGFCPLRPEWQLWMLSAERSRLQVLGGIASSRVYRLGGKRQADLWSRQVATVRHGGHPRWEAQREGVPMRRVALLTVMALLLGAVAGLAASPSIYTSPSANFAEVRRVGLFPFSVDPSLVQDPYAATKATALLSAALASHGVSLVDLDAMFKQMQADTQHTFASPPTPEDQKLFISLLPKYLDGAILGRISAWGIITVQGTRIIGIPTYGWGSGSGTVTGNWNGSWHSIQYVPVRVTREASVIGGTVALVRLHEDGSVSLLWEYNYVDVDRGGPFIWNHPSPPDDLAKKYFDNLAKVFPVH